MTNSSPSSDFQFHRERKREVKEKIEDVHVWIKAISHKDRSSWAFVYMDGKKDFTCIFGKTDILDYDRLQLVLVVEFLEFLEFLECSGEQKKRSAVIYTDSIYLLNVLKEWVDKWKKSHFTLPDGSDRPNADLLRKVESLRGNTTLNIKNLFTKNEFTEKIENLCQTELNRF